MAFSKHLEEIIEAALADGMITDKERAVLQKKAQMEGVDPDEVDVVIEGRLQQKYNEVEAAKQKVRKCPSCGEIIPAMTAVCPNCGQVVDTSNPDNKALQKYMEQLEKSLVTLKENGASKFNNKVRAELESMIRQGKSMYGDNKKINYLISEVEVSIENFEKAHKNLLIKLFSIAAIIIILAAFGIWKGVSAANEALDAQRQKEEVQLEKQKQEEKIFLAKGEEQCDSLCALLDKLPTPDRNNYKDCERQLNSITWKDIPCPSEDYHVNDKVNDQYGHSYKYTYLTKKRAYASQILSIYKMLYPGERTDGYAGSMAEQVAPDEISYPDSNIFN